MARQLPCGDNDVLESTQAAIDTREDLIALLRMLRRDLVENPKRWENDSLEAYLEALEAVLTDWSGRFKNRGEPVPEAPTWRLIGEILLSATAYE